MSVPRSSSPTSWARSSSEPGIHECLADNSLSGKPNWVPNVMAGLAKRDAAVAALQAMRQTAALGGFATEQLNILGRMQGSEQEWL